MRECACTILRSSPPRALCTFLKCLELQSSTSPSSGRVAGRCGPLSTRHALGPRRRSCAWPARAASSGTGRAKADCACWPSKRRVSAVGPRRWWLGCPRGCANGAPAALRNWRAGHTRVCAGVRHRWCSRGRCARAAARSERGPARFGLCGTGISAKRRGSTVAAAATTAAAAAAAAAAAGGTAAAASAAVFVTSTAVPAAAGPAAAAA